MGALKGVSQPMLLEGFAPAAKFTVLAVAGSITVVTGVVGAPDEACGAGEARTHKGRLKAAASCSANILCNMRCESVADEDGLGGEDMMTRRTKVRATYRF